MLSDEIAVKVEGLGKRFLVPQRHEKDFSQAPTWRERLKEFFPHLLGADDTDVFWALRDVSFEVRRGEVMGIVGENGSGKSTLLKILSGITPPTEGTAELRGRVGSLLEVGTGFHPDLTGRENIFLNGALLGARTSDIRAKLADIIAFSGIGEFIDVPVKRYSSGMYVRLAYSVTSLLDSDILILDEVLAVGDDAFREKSQAHMRNVTHVGKKTILFVSHNPRAVADVCDRAIIIHKGRKVFEGDAKEVLAEYKSREFLELPLTDANSTASEQLPHPTSSDDAVDPTASGGAHDAIDSTASGDADKAEDANSSHAPKRRHYQPQAQVDISSHRRMRYSGLPEPTKVLKSVSIHRLDGELCAKFRTFDGMMVRIGFAGITDPKNVYFSVLIHNSRWERMVTADSTVLGHQMNIATSGVVECIIPSLMVGDGIYSVMIDTGTYDFAAKSQVTQDCVAYATYIQVSLDGQLKGKGIDEFEGSVHRSDWSVVE